MTDETLNSTSRDSDEDSSYNKVARTFSKKKRLIEEDETEEIKKNEAINSQQKFLL